MITITRRLTFEAGHRIYGHESKCANLHGHSYKVRITARAPSLDPLGRIIDFSILNERIGSWLDLNWDHGTILFQKDPLVLEWRDSENLNNQKLFVAPFNPTAEELASFLLLTGAMLLKDTDVKVVKVQLWETENCYAEATL
jgi:6-pyruvoyltetrahydropterin/6-carboxytetrahydropterin synthase